MSDEQQDALDYQAAGVDYTSMDGLKRYAQVLAGKTADVLAARGYQEVAGSRGESAYVVDLGPFYLAMTPEGLGTKNLVADAMGEAGYAYYYSAGRDTAAMIINDIITVGARPTVLTPHWAAGNSNWFENPARYKALIDGWVEACMKAGAAYGSGETATLTGVIYPETVELSGAGVGVIDPKKRLTLGDKLRSGDHVILVESSGVHANGLSLVRKLASERLPHGYNTALPSGRTFGEAIMTPTHIYASLQQLLFEADIDIHYMVNITGHGWRKLMRATPEFTYHMFAVPPVQEEFGLIQKTAHLSAKEMYETFNMGAGFAFIVSSDDVQCAMRIAATSGLKSWDSGVVEEGPKQVVIEPENIIFGGDSMNLR